MNHQIYSFFQDGKERARPPPYTTKTGSVWPDFYWISLGDP